MTAYPIQDDALKTGELDYVNGGIQGFYMFIELYMFVINWYYFSFLVTVCHYFSCTCSLFHSRKLPRTSCCHCPGRVILSLSCLYKALDVFYML